MINRGEPFSAFTTKVTNQFGNKVYLVDEVADLDVVFVEVYTCFGLFSEKKMLEVQCLKE